MTSWFPHPSRLATIGFAVATAGAQPKPNGVAFTHVNVIPMDRERVLADQTVIVSGGVITNVGPANSIAVPAGTPTVDGRNRYLIPGLIDAHVHLVGPRDIELAVLKIFIA